MADYAKLKDAITEVIKTNGNQEITGQILQNTLLSIVNVIGEERTFAGVAIPDTNPGNPDQNVIWAATQKGTYTGFGNYVHDGVGIAFFGNTSSGWQAVKMNVVGVDSDGNPIDPNIYLTKERFEIFKEDLYASLTNNTDSNDIHAQYDNHGNVIFDYYASKESVTDLSKSIGSKKDSESKDGSVWGELISLSNDELELSQEISDLSDKMDNAFTQNGFIWTFAGTKVEIVFKDNGNTSIAFPEQTVISYGNTSVICDMGISMIEVPAATKNLYLVFNISKGKVEVVTAQNQMNGTVLLGWISSEVKTAFLKCSEYTVNGKSMNPANYLLASDIIDGLISTSVDKPLSANMGRILSTQNGMMQVLSINKTVSIDFSDSDQSVTISLPSRLLLSYGNARIVDSATSNGQVITDPMTDNRYKYLIYNLSTSQYELVLQTGQMNNSVLVGWINQYTKTAVLHCDNYTINGYEFGKSLAEIAYANIPTTVIQLKKYADDGYILIQLVSSIDTEVKITGGYASFNAVDFTETSIGIKKETLTNVYFRCVESFAIIEAKGVYSITVASNLTYNYVVQNIKDFGNLLTQFESSYNNGISGEIKDFNQDMKYICIGGGPIAKPNISGEFKDLPRLLTHLQFSNANGIHVGGDVADLPRKLTFLYLNVNLKIIGNPADLPKGLTYLNIYNLDNEFNGDIADFPRGLTSLTMSGTDYNISGNITDLPPNIQALQISGLSTVHGDISELPRSLKSMSFFGNCNLKGSLSDLPASANVFNLRSIDPTTPIIGDIGDIPNKKIIHFGITKNFNITFNGEFPISDQVYYFMLQPSEAFPIDSATVDNILIKLAAIVGERTGARTLNLTGACAAPTEASQAAITSLQQKGFTVQTN